MAKKVEQHSFVLLSVVAIALGIGCSSSTSTVTTGPTNAKCQLTLAPPANIAAAGGAAVLSITAQPECPWTASTDATWISNLSPASGQGDAKVEFVAASNPLTLMREDEIAINDSRVRVRQEAAPCLFTIDQERRTFSADSGTASIVVTTQEACKWTARSNAEWITIRSGTEGAGNGSVEYRVSANNGSSSRTGTVTIADRTHTVIQRGMGQAPPPTPPSPTPPSPAPPSPTPPPAPPACTYAINPTSQTLAAGGGPGSAVTVTTSASCPWTATSTATWLTVTSGASGTGTGSVEFSGTPNTSAALRNGTLTIAGHTFSISQVACTYAIDPTSRTLAAGGGFGGLVTVTATERCPWTATSNVPWLTITSGASGTGNGSVGFNATLNGTTPRTGTLTIARHTFTVSQIDAAPEPCTYDVNPTSFNVPASGGTGSFVVATRGDCSWSATNTASWISFTTDAGGSGTRTVRFSVTPQDPGSANREGDILVNGTPRIRVSQAAAVPSHALEP